MELGPEKPCPIWCLSPNSMLVRKQNPRGLPAGTRCMSMCVCACVNECMHTDLFVCLFACMCAYIGVFVYAYTCILYVYIYTYLLNPRRAKCCDCNLIAELGIGILHFLDGC